MSFFLRKDSSAKGKKRKHNEDLPFKKSKQNGIVKGKGKKKRDDNRHEDEEILSDASDVEGRDDVGYESEDEDGDIGGFFNKETAEEKRLRLAKAYLEEIDREERERAKDDADLHEAINSRVKRDDLEESGRLKRDVAHLYGPTDESHIRFLRDKVHKSAITCVVISPDGKHVFSGSKDAGLVKWDLQTGGKLLKLPGGRKGTEAKHKGHCSAINALAISSDGKFLASGDSNKLIHIWNPDTFDLIHTFRGHRDAVSGLAFRKKTHTLYSCSHDRAVKIWNLDEMAYVETLYGHQDKITCIDAGLRERAITSGGRDASVRVWKIVEESQLVFNGPATSTDAVSLVNEENFVTCGEDGHLSLWSVMKKKPVFSVQRAHGSDPDNQEANWISSLAAYNMTDLIATGSRDGFIRLWKCSSKSLEEVQKIAVSGFVNALAFSADGKHLVAGLGQEHRLGRWWRAKEAKNGMAVISLNVKDQLDVQ